jgi:hypothetical protein
VLVDGGSPQTLYLAESLRKGGLQVRLISTVPTLNLVEKWLPCVHVPQFESAAFAESLQDALKDPAVRWLYPVTDDAIDACRALLRSHPKVFPSLSEPQFGMLKSKHAVAEFAARHGIPVPEYLHVDSVESAFAAAQHFGYPVVLKGSGGCCGQQIAICENGTELARSYVKLAACDLVVQRFIRGNTWLAGGAFVNGTPVRLHICEKMELYPPGRGVSVTVRHAAPPALVDSLLTLFRELRWSGLASTDFIRAPDGTFYFLEINPRPWGAITAALASGIDIFSPMAAVLNGQTPAPELDIKPGWWGHVFPSYLNALADQGATLRVLACLLSPAFWRGVPKMSFRSFVHIIRDACWKLSHRRKEEAHKGLTRSSRGWSS